MAPKPKVKKPAAAAATETKNAKKDVKKTVRKNRCPMNREMANSGVMKHSRSKMYHKRALYKVKKTKPKAMKVRAKSYITKPIGGEKNGGTRTVRVHRMPKSYETQVNRQRLGHRKKPIESHNVKLRPSITPGTVLILLASKHKGKRVVFLKQLKSGLLLVTGPYFLNGCPLRRINQIYCIATKTKVDISKVKLPERLTDGLFKRKKQKKQKPHDGEIFNTAKEVYVVSEERKHDQVTVDKQIMQAINSREDKKMLSWYLGSMFHLQNRQYPHKMIF